MTLQETAKMNDAAIAAFSVFAKRQRYRQNTPVLRFHQELEEALGPVNQEQLFQMFKELEKQGLGSLVVSRKPYKTYFRWGYSLRDLARVAKGEIGLADAARIYAKKKHKVGKRPQTIKPIKPASVPQPIVEGAIKTSDVMVIKDGVATTIKLSDDNQRLFQEMLKVFQKSS
jgi:DNA-binding HxlR family transcriptional regulator